MGKKTSINVVAAMILNFVLKTLELFIERNLFQKDLGFAVFNYMRSGFYKYNLDTTITQSGIVMNI